MTRMFLLWAALVISMGTRIATAYEPETHREIAIQAAVADGTSDRVLKDELGVKDGVRQVLLGQRLTVQELVGEGAFSEDSPFTRSRNHFHNPLLSWDTAGLTGIFGGQSSVIWQQNRDQNTFLIGGGNWSWQDARQRYLSALTGVGLLENTREKRDGALADTFRTLGHLAHLVQDASVPAHSRNDPHVIYEGYETWADRARRNIPGGERVFFSRYLGAPVKPPLTIFARGRQEAPIPIARLIDSDLFEVPGNFGPLFEPALGIAEYSNGNFLSDDTIFQEFALPRRESLDLNSPILEADDKDPSRYRRYFSKVADGQRVTHFVAESTLYRDVTDIAGQPVSDALELTRAVYRDYGAELLPRAVGYSAALLDYFFRGKLEASIVADPADAEKLQVTAKNASSEPLGGGTWAVYGDYAGGERRPQGFWPIQGPVAPGDDLPSQSFRPDTPIPARYMVVYQGDLGEEKKDSPPGFVGAVIGKAAKYGGVLEELILFRTVNNTWDVYFRNQFQVTLLNLSENLPALPQSGTGVYAAEVHWGVDSNYFFVKNYELRPIAGRQLGVPVYHVYRINRPDNAVSGDEPVSAALVRTIQPPETPLPYYWRLSDTTGYREDGQYVYPFGLVFSSPAVSVLDWAVARQEVLAEDLGGGQGLEIYVLFNVVVYQDFESFTPPYGDGRGTLDVPLIIQASTGAIIYADPIAQPYVPQAIAAGDRGASVSSRFDGSATTWIVSWSDREVTKRRWVTQLQVDERHDTWDWTPDDGEINFQRHHVENSVQAVLIENGQPKFSITPKRSYIEIVYDETPARFYPAALVPTMSSERWLWIDEPDLFTSVTAENEKANVDILRRTQYLMSTETGVKQRVGEWTPADSSQYAIAPKIREMVMLPPGYLYAHGDPVYAIPTLVGYEGSTVPLAQDFTGDGEKQMFVRFLSPDGQVDPAFTTSVPLVEDPDLRGKGRVRTHSYPPGFQAVLDTIVNYYSSAKVSWHVVPDPDLIPARRR